MADETWTVIDDHCGQTQQVNASNPKEAVEAASQLLGWDSEGAFQYQQSPQISTKSKRTDYRFYLPADSGGRRLTVVRRVRQ